MLTYPMRIAGKASLGRKTVTIRSPYDDSPVAEVALGEREDMLRAIAAAAEAFPTMRTLPAHRRNAILDAVALEIGRRRQEIAILMARESGKPIRFCRAEVDRAILTFKLGAAEALRFGGEVLPVDLNPAAEGRLCLYTRHPRGPVAAISPFNFPLNLIAHKLSPAVAVGASVVLKPPPQCPLTGHLLAELLEQAGVPPGGLNVLHCSPEVAQVMVEDPRMKVLSFTGSDTVGWRLKALAGQKQVLLELGGNAPCVIDAGVDIAAIMPRLTTAAWANAGQICIKAQRLLVHASLYDDFLDAFVSATRAVPCGDPLDDNTVVGPLVERKHVERVSQWIQEAVSGGATKLCGGEVSGQVVTPAVLTRVRPEMRVWRDEVFGPVTVVDRFETFAEAMTACNASRFGLQAGVFTPSLSHALAAFRELEYGGVIINDAPTFRVDNFPYGGSKDSGFGREGVRFAMEEMSEPRVLVIGPG